jgi:predicted small lipoprotein YifL
MKLFKNITLATVIFYSSGCGGKGPHYKFVQNKVCPLNNNCYQIPKGQTKLIKVDESGDKGLLEALIDP